MWSFPPGWSGKLSTSKGRWFYWKTDAPTTTQTWEPPSWTSVVCATYNAHTRADPASHLYRSCVNFCKLAVLTTYVLQPEVKSLLDLACGKGGDVGKLGPFLAYQGMDAAAGAIDEARKRFPSRDFVVGDFLEKTSFDLLRKADAAYCSLALHYAGDRLDAVLKGVAGKLEDGARFTFIVLHESFPTTHPQGFGPLQIVRIEERQLGASEVESGSAAAKRIWVKYPGSFDETPEFVLSADQIRAAATSSGFVLETMFPLTHAIQPAFDYAPTEAESLERERLRSLLAFYPDHVNWDSLHYSFAACYQVYVLKRKTK